jgi:pantoate--beta-alanine ligase
MYGDGHLTWLVVEEMSDRLCGRSRPGHFRGVTTVVAKLFHIIEPDLACFGQKDAAQVAIIRRMVCDLNMAVAIVVCPIVREPDGLALSSRNAYWSPEERSSALVLYRSLVRAKERFARGEQDAGKLIAASVKEISREPRVRLDYFEVVDPDTLRPVPKIVRPALVAVAAFVGSTRLIDNILLPPQA